MARLIRTWLVVLAAFLVAIKAIDRLPALAAGTPHGVRVYAAIADAERAIGTRIWLPPYYPDTLAWPPSRVDVWAGPPVSVALHVAGRGGTSDRLLIVESLGGPAAPPESLLPAVDVLTSSNVPIGARQGLLVRAVAATGEVLHDVSWDHGSRRITLRYHGPVEELLLIAASLERNLS
jgi:hypothetical protein